MANELQAKIEAWKKEHGELSELIVSWDVEGAEQSRSFIVHKPKPASFDILMQGIMQKPTKAMKNFVISVLLHPSQEEFLSLAEKYPGVLMNLGNSILEEFGIKADVVKKKL